MHYETKKLLKKKKENFYNKTMHIAYTKTMIWINSIIIFIFIPASCKSSQNISNDTKNNNGSKELKASSKSNSNTWPRNKECKRWPTISTISISSHQWRCNWWVNENVCPVSHPTKIKNIYIYISICYFYKIIVVYCALVEVYIEYR